MGAALIRIISAAFAGFILAAHGVAAAASVDDGKRAFVQHGCWQCHGFEGQGSAATSKGKVIADTALPLDAFTAFVRTTSGDMPPFRPQVISDADLADIYAYLESRPKPKPVDDLPLLKQIP